jgi:hypothetical protein
VQGNSTAGNSTDAGEVEGEEEEAAEAEVSGGVHLAARKHKVTHLAQKVPKIPLAEVVGQVVKEAAAEAAARKGARKASPVGNKSPLQRLQVKKAAAKPANVMVVAPEQEPLQVVAQPMAAAAAAVARGHLANAVEAIAQEKQPVAGAYAPQVKVATAIASAVKPHAGAAPKMSAVKPRAGATPKMHASKNVKIADMKAAPVAKRAHGPADPATLPPVQAVAKPLTAAGEARKPVQAVAQPILPVKQVAQAV